MGLKCAWQLEYLHGEEKLSKNTGKLKHNDLQRACILAMMFSSIKNVENLHKPQAFAYLDGTFQ
jgi:hypothetical protein